MCHQGVHVVNGQCAHVVNGQGAHAVSCQGGHIVDGQGLHEVIVMIITTITIKIHPLNNNIVCG